MAHQNGPVLDPNSEALIPLPFQGMGHPGKGVPLVGGSLKLDGLWRGQQSSPKLRHPALFLKGGSRLLGSVSTTFSSNIREAHSASDLCWGTFTVVWSHNFYSTLRYRLCFAFSTWANLACVCFPWWKLSMGQYFTGGQLLGAACLLMERKRAILGSIAHLDLMFCF